MARGFLSGAIWGTVLSAAGLGTISVLSPTAPQMPSSVTESALPPDDTAQPVPEAIATPEVTEPDATVEEAVVTPDPAVPETPTVSAAEQSPDTAAELPPPETPSEPSDTTAAQQETGSPAETSSAPVAEPAAQPGRRPTDVSGVVTDSSAPALTVPGGGTDAAPGAAAMEPTKVPETGQGVADLSAPQAAGASGVTINAGSPPPQPAASAPSLIAPQSDVGVSVSTEPAQPPAPAIPEVQTALVPEPAPEVGAATVDPAPVDMPETDATAPEAESAPQKPTVRRLVPETVAPGSPENTDTAALTRPSIGKPAGSLIDRAGSNSSRLPSIGESTAAEDSSGADSANVAASGETGIPLERFAARVDADPSLPRMAIVLIDDGAGPLGPDTLDNFPFPVTFALDPAKAGAAQRMAAYRALGYEVATLADLPEGATPSDVEQLLAGAIAALPESVAFIEAPGGALQSSRSNTEQLAGFAAESGHGLVFMPNGLNTAEAIARRDNVAAVSVLRDFDGDGQDARTKRRFLDGAAFRARQDGAAVMLGRLTPDTLSALLLWSLQDRASSVAMVPVSTVLINSVN